MASSLIPNDRSRAASRAAALLLALAGLATAPHAHALSFAAQQTFATGTAPHSIEYADLNGDGIGDLIVANQTAGTVSVLLGTTAPGATTASFAAQQTVTVGKGPADVIAVDVNADGNPDLVVANSQDATVSVLLNTTAAGATTVTFATPQTFKTREYPYAVVAADIDADGKPDLVVANVGSTVVSVLRNTTAAGATSASFADQQLFSVGYSPAAIAVADFNRDGMPDLAVANFGANTISLLLNTTAAGATTLTFADQTTLATGSGPSSMVVADIDGDNRPDLVVTDAFDYATSVFLNTTAVGAATPTFADRKNFTTSVGAAFVAVADFNGDGRPDLAVPNQSNKTVSVLVNTTSGTLPQFAAVQNFTAGADPVTALAADVNADGTPDLIVANSTDSTVSVLLNTTSFAGVNLDQHGITGSWFNPGAPGQGLEIEVYPDLGGAGQGLLFAGWFTFDATAAGGQRWYSLQGAVSSADSTAQLGIYAGEGGNFAAPPAVAATQVGTATLHLSDCVTGFLTYAFDDGRSGTIPLSRLTANVTCSPSGDNGSAAANYPLSGSWYDPATPGQGLVFDVNPTQQVFFAGWYTYAPDGAQTGGAASERWYVIQAAFAPGATALANAPIYTATGGAFNDFVPTTTTQVGTANITFASCNAVTLAYTFTSGTNSGLSGTLNLTRTGPVPQGCSL